MDPPSLGTAGDPRCCISWARERLLAPTPNPSPDPAEPLTHFHGAGVPCRCSRWSRNGAWACGKRLPHTPAPAPTLVAARLPPSSSSPSRPSLAACPFPPSPGQKNTSRSHPSPSPRLPPAGSLFTSLPARGFGEVSMQPLDSAKTRLFPAQHPGLGSASLGKGSWARERKERGFLGTEAQPRPEVAWCLPGTSGHDRNPHLSPCPQSAQVGTRTMPALAPARAPHPGTGAVLGQMPPC